MTCKLLYDNDYYYYYYYYYYYLTARQNRLKCNQSLTSFVDHLPAANLTEEQLDSSHFCVWMTCKTDSAVPDHLIQRLHKVSWTHVLSLARPHPDPPAPTPGTPAVKAADGQSHKSGDGVSQKEGAVATYITPQKYLREGQSGLERGVVYIGRHNCVVLNRRV